MYALGLSKDGTIQGWEVGFGPRGPPATLVPVQTKLRWRAVSAYGPTCLGVSIDGSIWSWQRVGFFPLTFSSPTQESYRTNWVGVMNDRYAWSSSGELWGTPNTHLTASNAISGRFALGSVVYEIRSDNTLWATGTAEPSATQSLAGGGISFRYGPLSPAQGAGATVWRRIGNRSDWVSVWGADGTYYGLTSEGTVWVWGSDWGQQPLETLQDRLAHFWDAVRLRFHSVFGGAAAVGPRPSKLLTQPVQNEPRPLMRFKSMSE